MLYFRDDQHTQDFLDVLSKYEILVPDDHRPLASFLFLLTATRKHTDFEFVLAGEDIDMEEIESKILFYPDFERQLIRFGLQLFDPTLDDITLHDVMTVLPNEKLKQSILKSIMFRYEIILD